MAQLSISQEHKQSLEGIQAYVTDNRIQELFNEMLTNILQTKPPNARQYIIQCLKNIQKIKSDDPHSKQMYQFPEAFLSTEDFEAVFDSYDILGIQTVPIAYLLQGMKVVGIENAQQIISERYPELGNEETVNKVTFVYILEEEHKRVGYSY